METSDGCFWEKSSLQVQLEGQTSIFQAGALDCNQRWYLQKQVQYEELVHMEDGMEKGLLRFQRVQRVHSQLGAVLEKPTILWNERPDDDQDWGRTKEGQEYQCR